MGLLLFGFVAFGRVLAGVVWCLGDSFWSAVAWVLLLVSDVVWCCPLILVAAGSWGCLGFIVVGDDGKLSFRVGVVRACGVDACLEATAVCVICCNYGQRFFFSLCSSFLCAE